MRGQRGFIYPVTMLICLLLIPVVLHQMNLYLKEKRFVYEQERLLRVESLLQVGINDFQKKEQEPIFDDMITYVYDEGKVFFTVYDYTEGISFISVKVQLHSGHKRIAGFHYDWTNSTITNYWEVSDSISVIFPKAKWLL